ncbi:hypothetical protein HNQ94_001519 [Salirhabdus euzebyi]|uniref:Uncharacterized protein n=1 Tax=Salirhabdus euzebyi TaxID=394506 RepID=A0A841Q3T4_9BACI|nr:hypothetical protein [Salirhabdus euzebyi]MBB6453071.1 hypothetical protein [Salirhabdus euzebyi]
MGYILPVRQFEYETYHKRMMGNNQSPFQLEGPVSTRFKKVNHEQQHPLDISYEQKNNKKTANRNTSSENAQLIAEITGKGIFFNEKI